MAVKVKIQKKEKKRRPMLTAKDYAEAGERVEKFKAWGLTLIIFGALIGSAFAAKKEVGLFVNGWFWLTLIIYFFLAPNQRRSRLRKLGLDARVMPGNYPLLKRILTEYCPRMGIREPEAYVTDGTVGTVEVFGTSKPFILVVTKPLLEALKPQELACAVIHEFAKIRSGHVVSSMVCRLYERTPPGLRVFVLPVTLLAALLSRWWRDSAEATADRLTLLTVRNARVFTATIVKQAVSANPVANVTPQEIEEYLQQKDPMKATSVEVTAHFDIGRTVHDNIPLNQRLRAIVDFAGSTEYQELVTKMDEAEKTAAEGQKGKREGRS